MTFSSLEFTGYWSLFLHGGVGRGCGPGRDLGVGVGLGVFDSSLI